MLFCDAREEIKHDIDDKWFRKSVKRLHELHWVIWILMRKAQVKVISSR